MKRFMEFARHDGNERGREDTVIVVDNSPSMRMRDYPPTRIGAARNAISELIEAKIEHHPADRVAVVGFSSSATTIHPLASVREEARALKRSLKRFSSGFGTNIAAGLRAAFELFGGSSRRPGIVAAVGRWIRPLFVESDPPPERPLGNAESLKVILLSDGADNSGSEDPEDVARELELHGACVHVIGIGDRDRNEEFEEDRLKRIASVDRNGSPRYVYIGDADELIREFKTLARHIAVL